MPELCPQEEARNIVHLAAWYLFEHEFLGMLLDDTNGAGCTLNEARVCMTGEVS
jgi:hypothetical protein